MAVSPPPAKPMNSLPDYSILFWHRISDWNASNLATHGVDPSSTSVTTANPKVFSQYQLGAASAPEIPSYYSPNKKTLQNINYVVRCVSDANNWPSLCDLRYDANTNMSENQSTLLFTGGAHSYNLVGRNMIPPLMNDYKPNSTSTTTNVSIKSYTYPHEGHTHTVKNLYKSLIDINSGSSNYLKQSNGSYIPQSFGSFFVDPIIKDPKLSMKIITYIPKDIIVMYYGNSTLPSGYYNPYDISANSYFDQSANGYALPITFSQTKSNLDPNKIGAMNINILKNISEKTSSSIVDNKFANNINFQNYSDYSGYHDHKNDNIVKYASSSTARKFDVIPESMGATKLLSNIRSPTGPDTISHTHNVTYTCNMQLKSNRLKAFLSTNPYSPIVNGLIIGYSIGKYSGFTGPNSSGKNTLPKGWYFCDGQNGTPDLRGRYPFLNFTQDDVTNGVFENSSSKITITNIDVETINWQHGHATPSSPVSVVGAGGKVDMGSHSSFYDATSDSTNTTRHNHVPSLANTTNGTALNATIGTTFDYEPPTTEIAFIMYNDTI
jgi:hypothetical protein